MSHSINIKSLTSLFSKSLFYIFIPVSLMGMFQPGNPPGPDLYVQTYDALTGDYNNTNGNTNQFLIDYNAQLLDSINSMHDGAQQAFLWADHHNTLAQIDGIKAGLVYDRIVSIFGRISTFAASAKARATAVQAGVPGAAAQPDDQNILNAFNAASNIRQQAETAANEAQAAANRAQVARQNVLNARNGIQNRINQINQPIFNNINYTADDVLACTTAFTYVKNNFNTASTQALHAKDHALEVHNQVNNLDQLMVNIRQQGVNINIQLP